MIAGRAENLLEMSIPENPFPGLRPFEFNESLLYFGRDGQSEQLLRKLGVTRFLAVVGTSGSGKSSLVRAGLLPALFGGFMTSAGSDWLIALMRPGSDPIGNLARALAAPGVLGSDDGDPKLLSAMAESTLRRGSLGLVDLVRQARIGSNQNLLIVADQFEELFRFARVEASESYSNDAAAFVKLLLEASRQREAPIYVVLTMRSDFLGDCSSFWGLPEAINEGQYLIPRLTRKQRREAITGPIAVCGGQITDRLVTRLLNDMGDDQDQLPILQHALMRTWGKWKEQGQGGTAIDLQHYEAIGQMSDALSLHADEAFNSLPDERSRQVAERAFKGLTEKGPDNREIRRPVTLCALCALAGAEESELVNVIDTFRREGRSFLMPPAGAPLSPEAMIDISHESLIRNWKRLKEWSDEEARSARVYRRLAETAALHREGKAGLWRDPDLQIALTWRAQSQPNKEWAARYHHEFEEAIGFLDESLAAREAEQRMREAEALEKENRRSRQIRNFRLTTAVLGAAFLICLGTLGYANRQRQEASAALERVRVQESRVEAEKVLADKNAEDAKKNELEAELQKVLAEKNAEDAQTNELEASAQKARADQQTGIALRAAGEAEGAKKQALHLLYAANLNLAQRAHQSGDVARADELLTEMKKEPRGFEWSYLWKTYHSAERTIRGFERPVTSVAFSPVDKNLLATASADGKLALIDSLTGISEPLYTNANSVWSSIFSPEGNRLAVLSDSNTVELWDVPTRQRLSKLPVEAGVQVETIAFGKNGKLAAGNEDGTITLWDVDTLQRKTLPYPHPEEAPIISDVGALLFSSDGKTLASGYENGVLGVWDLASGGFAEQKLTDKITALAISPDDKLLAASTDKGCLSIWVFTGVMNRESFEGGPDGTRSEEEEPLFKGQLLPQGLNCLAFSNDGEELATAGADKVVTFWQMKQLRTTRSRLLTLFKAIKSAKDDPDQLKRLEEQIKTVKNEAKGRLDRGKDRIPLEHSGPITCIAFSGDGHTFASGSSDRSVKVWRLGDDGNRDRGIISPDGSLVATVEPDAIKVHDAARGVNKFAIKANVASMVFSPDSKAIIARFADGTVRLYHPGDGKEIEIPGGKQAKISPDGGFVATGDAEVVRVWDTSRGEILRLFRAGTAGSTIGSLAFSPDSHMLAVSPNAGTTKLYYIERDEEFEIPGIEGGQSLSFDPSGKFLSLASTVNRGPVVKTWDVEKRRLLSAGELEAQQSIQPALTMLSPRGDKVASAQDESITLSDAKSGRFITTNRKAHLLPVTSLAFSRDGNTLASGSLDGTVKLWDARSLNVPPHDIPALQRLDRTLNPIKSLTFSPDGKRLALGDAGKTVVLWDLLTAQELFRLKDAGLPESLAFSADGMALGGHTLGSLWLGAPEMEPDKVTRDPNKSDASMGHQFTWASNRDGVAIPDNALTAGYGYELDHSNRVPLYICRLQYMEKWYVGYTSGGDCHIGMDGRRLSFGIYEVLTNADAASWFVSGADDPEKPMPPAVFADAQDGKRVTVCRAVKSDYSNQAGKVVDARYIGWAVDGTCHIGRGTEVSIPTRQFEILHGRP